MSQIVDVVIIGSGALGCAAAYCLAESGTRRVAVVDRGPLVSGMTRRNAGLVHTHLPNVSLMRLTHEGLEDYRHWATLIGGACGFNETGTIVTAANEESARRLRVRVELQQSLGIEARILEPSDLGMVFPRASFKDIILGAFEPTSGYVDPVLASQGFARRAREKGTRFETGTQVKHIGQERGRITEIVTTTGSIQAPVIVVTAGAGAERLLAPLGFSLSLQYTRGVIGFFEQPAALHEGHPTFIESETAAFIRPHAFHLSTAGVVDSHWRMRSSDSLEEVLSPGETSALSAFAVRRLPLLEEAPLRRSHAILYDQMPDGNPALGAVPGFEGLYIASGFGVNAIAAAPAVGRIIAELVLDGRSTTDIEAFRPGRSNFNSSNTH